MAAYAELADFLKGGAAVLDQAGVPSPLIDARHIAAHLLQVRVAELALIDALPEDFPQEFAVLIERRRQREPLQHILGTAPFRYLELAVGPGVFVPRPETEQVAQRAIDEVASLLKAGESPVVVDLCTGSGAIALAIAHETGVAVTAVELSDQAVAYTARNIETYGLPVTLVHADATAPTTLNHLDGTVDVLVSNPPYIPLEAVPVDPEVRDYDPDIALYGGGLDGLTVPHAVVLRAAQLLRPGGLLVMEHADVQGAALRGFTANTGLFDEVSTEKDLTGRDRMLRARLRSDRLIP